MTVGTMLVIICNRTAGLMLHCNPWAMEAGGLRIQGQPGLHETLSLKSQNKRNKTSHKKYLWLPNV